jgi:predicted nuclease of predicted toxin-antitoxin system
MRVLFDQNVPRNLRRFLVGHEVATAPQMSWEELANGELIAAAETGGFEVFVTGDQNLSYQQTLVDRTIAIVELTKNNWPSVEPHVEEIVAAVDDATPGTYRIVECTYVFKGRRPSA